MGLGRIDEITQKLIQYGKDVKLRRQSFPMDFRQDSKA